MGFWKVFSQIRGIFKGFVEILEGISRFEGSLRDSLGFLKRLSNSSGTLSDF